jgi:uracil phosphoribosyltransferase
MEHYSYLNSHSKVNVLPRTNQTIVLHTKIRNIETNNQDFVLYSSRLIRLVLEYSTNFLPCKSISVMTPTDIRYEGMTLCDNICGVSIMRGGDAMASELQHMIPGVRIGKILIQRDDATAKPRYYYDKLPKDIHNYYILLMDPMLATAGTASCAIELLKSKNVSEDRIILVTLIATPEGISSLHEHFPDVRLITSEIDKGINNRMFVIPGLGDFGDRYFGTEM